jgi:uncharacterized protein (TIGR02246 family)
MKLTNVIIAISLVCVAAFFPLLAPVGAEQAKPGATPGGAKSLTKEESAAIRKVVAGFEEAWNTHDMKALEKLFSEDAEFINVVGMHWRGRKAIVAAHAAYHETIFKNHRIKTDTVEIRTLGEGHAIAVATLTGDSFKTPDGQVIPMRQHRLTYVLTKGSDGWKISHGHNVAVDPDAAQFDPVNKTKK